MRRMRVATTILMWVVYVGLALATFRHTAWGFGTLETTLLAPVLSSGGAFFWITGAFAALALDAGLVGCVLAVQIKAMRGADTKSMIRLVVFVAFLSTITQVLYAVTHAVPLDQVEINVAARLVPYATLLWEYRVLYLPAVLPALSVLYAFVAREVTTELYRPDDDLQEETTVEVTPYVAQRVGPRKKSRPEQPKEPEVAVQVDQAAAPELTGEATVAVSPAEVPIGLVPDDVVAT